MFIVEEDDKMKNAIILLVFFTLLFFNIYFLTLQAEVYDSDSSQENNDSEDDKMYDYLLGMTMWTLTKERKDELLKKRDEKLQEYKVLQGKSPSDLWTEDLKDLLEEVIIFLFFP